MPTIDLRGLVRPQLVESTKRDDNPNVAEFRLQPLERGFGHTLGNSMRRMLLSSLRGAAVWGFRIDGVVHEHQTIAGVVEDVHQIIGNLKTLTLVLADDLEEAVLRISKSDAGPVTAGDIQDQGGVRIVDAAHHLFTLQDARDINVELYVGRGRGYVEADQHAVDKTLPVDVVRRRADQTVADDQMMIEEGHAGLESVRHAELVFDHQHAVQERLGLEVQRVVDVVLRRARRVGAAKHVAEDLLGAYAGQPVAMKVSRVGSRVTPSQSAYVWPRV